MTDPYYQEGGITIYCADSRLLLPELAAESVVLTLTDPPYNLGLDYSDGDNRPDYREWCGSWFRMLPRPLVFTPGRNNLQMWHAISNPSWTAIWHNPTATGRSSVLRGFSVWEPLLIFGQPRGSLPHDLITVPMGQQAHLDGHPCPKPLALWRKLILAFTEPGDLVLDPFLGSGTTARACKDLGRRCIGIEISEAYCELSVGRLAQGVLPMGVV